MDDERVVALLERIADSADKTAFFMEKTVGNVDRLVEAIPKSASRVQKIIELAALIAGILSIIGVIEIIRNWILRG